MINLVSSQKSPIPNNSAPSVCILHMEYGYLHQNMDTYSPSLLSRNLWLFFMGLSKKKIFFFEKKKSKMADSKKPHFAKRSILNIFLPNWAGWVHGLVELIDASINSTNPEDPSRSIWQKNIENRPFGKMRFFWIGHFGFFLLNPMKCSQRFLDSKDGSKFWWLPWFPAF